jgi:hypothetical protein
MCVLIQRLEVPAILCTFRKDVEFVGFVLVFRHYALMVVFIVFFYFYCWCIKGDGL